MKIENVGIAWDILKKQDNYAVGNGEIYWINGDVTDISFRYDKTHHTCEITHTKGDITSFEKTMAEIVLLENIEANLWTVNELTSR